MVPKPEESAREQIDAALVAAGWLVQNADAGSVNLDAGLGVAVREFPLDTGFADYLLFVAGKAAGTIEAKKVGVGLSGVEVQVEKYTVGLPKSLPAHVRPLPFGYLSTGVETVFVNGLDPRPRSRRIFHFHRPETLAEWLAADPLWLPLKDGKPQPESERPSTLRSRLARMPALDETDLWPAQVRAIQKLELSLADNRPRALIQMATGSGKSRTAVASIYRLIRYGGAQRVLFLVDRGNLGRQTLREFQSYDTPEGRKFHQEFNVQHLTTNSFDPVARVVICTIQRLYSMLRGEDLDPALEEESAFAMGELVKPPPPVVYNTSIPVEAFDFVWTDECHRSIYHQWRQVLEYFDSFLVGLTATPSTQTLGFFGRNLVMEYGHEAAVADGCNVDFTVYEIATRITQQGSSVEAGLWVDKRDRETRAVRWEQLDTPLVYNATELDRAVVAEDQIRTVIRTFKEKLFTEIFPGRRVVPKTLIFAKDDSHAEDIVRIVREEFGEANQFAEKITYRTGTARIPTGKVDEKGQPVYEYKSTGLKPEDLLASFRNSFYPRIAVTVDMIATGTDVKPLEIVFFMRSVRSRLLFEQMKGRGVRVVSEADFQQVTPDAVTKDRFVIVDAVGACHSELSESQPLDRQPTVSFEKLLQAVAFGSTDKDVVSSLASRLARMNRQLGKADQKRLQHLAGGVPLQGVVAGLVDALDPDRHIEEAKAEAKLGEAETPSAEQVAKAAERLIAEAVALLKSNAPLRKEIIELRKAYDQTIDKLSQDEVLAAGFSPEAREKAKGLVDSFRKYIEENKEEITALQVLYSQPYAKRLQFRDIKALAETIKAPPRAWTPERLWAAYETLDRSKVKGVGAKRLLTDVVSLVRFAIHQDETLTPFTQHVEARFENWLAQQDNKGERFTDEQREWLYAIKDHIAASFGIERDDFEDVPFNQKGGLGKVYALFGSRLDPLLDELNEVLVA